MTNYELIADTPGDLADFLADVASCEGFIRAGICPEGGCIERMPICETAALDWLMEECDE